MFWPNYDCITHSLEWCAVGVQISHLKLFQNSNLSYLYESSIWNKNIPSKCAPHCSTDFNPWKWGWYDIYHWILRIQHGWVILDQGGFSCYATIMPALVSNVSRGYCRVTSQFPAIFMLFCCHWLKWIGWIGDNSKPKERSRVCRVKKRLVTRLSCLLRTLCTYIESKKILNTDCPLLLCICFWPC